MHQNPTIHRKKTYLLNQWMDMMYLSTLDLPRSLISESRTFSPSSSQVSWIYQHISTLYTANPRTYSPYTQPTRVHMHPIHRQLVYASKNRVFCESKNFSVNPSCYLRRSPLQMYPQVFTRSFTQGNRYTICTSVCIVSELYLLFIYSCSLTLSLF
jgi:hypothetical protein